VNKVRGREESGVWMDGEDSIKQMAMIDSAYEKAGLPIRPTSSICRAFTTQFRQMLGIQALEMWCKLRDNALKSIFVHVAEFLVSNLPIISSVPIPKNTPCR
jgi:hypothetical protein